MVEPVRRFLEICGGSICVAAFFVVITGTLVVIDAGMRGATMQMDFNYPDNPGYKGQLTSKAAAETKKSTKVLDQQRVVEALRASDGGLTADEVAAVHGEVFLKYRPRFSELRKLGKIQDTGERRPSALGNAQIVWSLTNGE
jgi:hypothetical protein